MGNEIDLAFFQLKLNSIVRYTILHWMFNFFFCDKNKMRGEFWDDYAIQTDILEHMKQKPHGPYIKRCAVATPYLTGQDSGQ